VTQITETHIKQLHALATTGRHSVSPYRSGQNTIRGKDNKTIVYWPPKPKEIPELMQGLVDWLNDAMARAELPLPLIAALTHYQLLTIHPYFDGNYRTASLLTKLVLKIGGQMIMITPLNFIEAIHWRELYPVDKIRFQLMRIGFDIVKYNDQIMVKEPLDVHGNAIMWKCIGLVCRKLK